MTVEETTKISGKTKLADLTVDDLLTILRAEMKDFVRDLVQEAIEEYDPDAGLELKPEVVEYLKKPLEEKGPLISMEELKRELQLDE